MSESLSVNPTDITDLANRYYDRLISYGTEALTYNPIVNMRGPARAEIYWPEESDIISGFHISKANTSTRDDDLATIGFTPRMQQEGLWGIRTAQKQILENGEFRRLRDTDSSGSVYAHFNPVDEVWHAAYLKDGPRQETYADNWDIVDHLQADEQAVIERVAEETAMLLDTAATLGENTAAYQALTYNLQEMAQSTAEDSWAMAAIFESWKTWPQALCNHFTPSTYSQLQHYAIPLYRALAGKEVGRSGSILTLKTLITNFGGLATGASLQISEATICPAYQPVGQSLAKANVPVLGLS